MMSKAINLQDVFLNQVRKDKTSILVYLTNGFQLKGIVRGFDNFIVILETDGKQQMIYKHAISTIIPSKEVHLMVEEREGLY
ncbi:MAG: RNA chaperone Hfq [Vallitaleaceae bacterium]|nr:RNA chaperone Hfq [Vallitaleaceae bacterium]